jgi:heme o synthase
MIASSGFWLRLTAAAGVAATALVVATGGWGGLSHQTAALVALALLAGGAVAVRLAYPRRSALVRASALAVGIFGAQVGVGGVVAATGAAPWARSIHIALGAVSLAAAAVAGGLTFRPGTALAAGSWRDYVTLTKPRIMVLLLITAASGMVVGAGGLPPPGPFAAMMGGLALACGGASALNHVLDRDIDRLMGARTERRPVAAGRVSPERALEYGLALSALSFAVLTVFTNVLAAGLAVFGNLFYVLVYTCWLKRSTPQNIVIGGAAGAIPPLVGWSAATGNLTVPAIALFLIVFTWTPPHFWALALLIRRNYEAAHIPMLPVARGERHTVRSILWYTTALVAVTLLPVALHTVGVVYLAAALALGAVFLALAVALARETTPERAARLFHYSLAYLALLFLAMALDPVVLG